MSSNNLIHVLTRQFDHSWVLLRQAIFNISDNYWKKIISQDEKNFWTFSLTVYHIIETTDYYMRFSPDDMEWGLKGNIDWESSLSLEQKISRLTKTLVVQYLDEIQPKLTKIFALTPNSQFFKPDSFSWFPCILDKYLYLLRHNMMHIGELNKALRNCNNPRINWQ